ncbi:hypothetical protein KC951_04295, partial [Candidatus Saccharibacteria bacterium]|nr:hypothetical protein [Candidatus Saccharibacteria bacterium]
VRVLKPGGKAYLGPIVEVDGMPFNKSKFFDALEKSGVEYSVKTERIEGVDIGTVTLTKNT